MVLIGAGHQSSSKEREKSVLQEAGMEQSHPPGAQPSQANRSIAEKVAGLTNQAVYEFPAGVGDEAKNGLKEQPERGAGVVGSLRWSRLFGQFSSIFKWRSVFRFRLPRVQAGG